MGDTGLIPEDITIKREAKKKKKIRKRGIHQEDQRWREFTEIQECAANLTQTGKGCGPQRACCYGNVIIAGNAFNLWKSVKIT